MRQAGIAQRPAVDLRMVGGIGFIKGCSGLDDLRGSTFSKASAYLKALAQKQREFTWIIILDLDNVISSAFKSLFQMIDTLDGIARDPKLQAKIEIIWKIHRDDDSMSSLVRDVEQTLLRQDLDGIKVTVAEKRDLFLSYSYSDKAFVVWLERPLPVFETFKPGSSLE